MGIVGKGNETYIYINGITISRNIVLGNGIILEPAKCSSSPDTIIKTSKSEIDMGIAILFLRQTSCQLHIKANNPKELATKAWNSQWDIILISALVNAASGFNIQCNVPAESFNSESQLNITNYHLKGFSKSKPYLLSEKESLFIENNIENARELLNNADFSNAISSLYSYIWHPHPRIQLAVLWSGIEGIFSISNELVFRLSLYIAQFLSPENKNKRREIFENVKTLYKIRSKAVHGEKIKGDTKKAIEGSIKLLKDLLWKIIEINEMPNPDNLIP